MYKHGITILMDKSNLIEYEHGIAILMGKSYLMEYRHGIAILMGKPYLIEYRHGVAILMAKSYLIDLPMRIAKPFLYLMKYDCYPMFICIFYMTYPSRLLSHVYLL
jgi:hypothetical protein